MALASVLLAWWIKERYWIFIDTTSARSTVASATALGSRGRVRMFEAPHTQENYLLKEMGFQIARKHARRLRLIARLTGFIDPGAGQFDCGNRRRRPGDRGRRRRCSSARRLDLSSNAGCFLLRQSIPSRCTTAPRLFE